MNILHVVDWAGLGGGAEVIAFHAANSLPGKNYVYFYRRVANFDENEFANVTLIQSKRDFSFLNLFANVRELKKIIKEHNIDIVHSQLFWSNLTARLATPKSKKLFTTIHNIQSRSSLQSKRMQLLERLIYRKSETTFCVSEEVKKDYKTIVPTANTVTLYNFISDRFFENGLFQKQNRNDGKIKFIAVGSIKPQKNYSLLINVFAELKKRGKTNIYLDIYGGGELMPKLQKQAKELEINVEFKGEILNLYRFYQEYDAFIMASLFEGYGLSVLEAFASRVPALLSDISVIKEVTNSNGIFFNPESVEDCVEKILNFCDDKYDTTELVQNSFLWAKKVAQKSTYLNKLVQYYNK
jgi:glycosyltransferase involved in cell wall biosynthesis